MKVWSTSLPKSLQCELEANIAERGLPKTRCGLTLVVSILTLFIVNHGAKLQVTRHVQLWLYAKRECLDFGRLVFSQVLAGLSSAEARRTLICLGVGVYKVLKIVFQV